MQQQERDWQDLEEPAENMTTSNESRGLDPHGGVASGFSTVPSWLEEKIHTTAQRRARVPPRLMTRRTLLPRESRMDGTYTVGGYGTEYCRKHAFCTVRIRSSHTSAPLTAHHRRTCTSHWGHRGDAHARDSPPERGATHNSSSRRTRPRAQRQRMTATVHLHAACIGATMHTPPPDLQLRRSAAAHTSGGRDTWRHSHSHSGTHVSPVHLVPRRLL